MRTLTQEEQRFLLALARETIAAKLEHRAPQEPETIPAEPGTWALTQPCGAFVTLHIEKQLRGCIGRLSASDPLEKTVRAMALEAAFGDPRFPPLTAAELPRCRLELSVLTPLEPCGDPRSVRLGVHGLYLIHRGRAGVLLPQVPLEQGWDLDAYLDHLCLKAGLPLHSYEAPGARLYTFTAAVFGED
ncbi:MAG: AmmeMemoRadiSam system protein A [Treponema sp.]|jgi:AmmeMemoRadiSam system protein A|nr:AmmeMemoRadiSam system protein A [Treponema sp.]